MSTRPDLHDAQQIKTYIAGMNASVSDKARILPFVTGPDVAELGCGDGVVLELLANLKGVEKVTGYDLCGRLLHEATQRQYPVPVTLHRADLLKQGTGKHNTIVACSFLHEIYSEMAKAGEEPAYWKWLRSIIVDNLEPGGRFIIRDGVAPEFEILSVKFSDELLEKWYRFSDDFAMKSITSFYDSQTGRVTLLASDLFEFATKFFYDQNWSIEMKETFGWATHERLTKSFPIRAMKDRRERFKVVHSETYTIPFLRDEKWAGNIQAFRNDGTPYELTSTMIVVYERMDDAW